MERKVLNGGTLLSPLPPALISCGTMEESNIMTAAWTGIICSDPALTYVSIRPSRYSYGLIKDHMEFVINLPQTKYVKEVDFCGVFTGKKVNKFDRCKFTKKESEQVKAPTISECPIALECKVREITHYGTHDMFLAEIVCVTAKEELFDEKGRLHIEKADLIAYAHGDYYAIGKKIGKFGFSATKKKGNHHARKS